MPLILIEHHHHYPDSDSSTLTSMLRTMMENIMAQIDDLMLILNAVHDDVTTVLSKVTDLESQLTQLQQTTPPQVDLQPAIDAATAIRQQLEGTTATTADATGATPAPTEPAAPTDTSASAETVTATDTASADVTSAPTDPTAGTQPAA